MSPQVLVTAARQVSRNLRVGTGIRASSTRVGPSLLANLRNDAVTNRLPQTPIRISRLPARTLSTTAFRRGIMPDDQPVAPKEAFKKIITPAHITDDEFHRAANDYLEILQAHFEYLQDKREDVDVEYSDGVLTVSFGHDKKSTYVINKQPPNKQIWVSSPKSGPKRYDLVVVGEGQHEKADTAASEWMYLRDNSTMNQLFIKELGIDLSMPPGHYGE